MALALALGAVALGTHPLDAQSSTAIGIATGPVSDWQLTWNDEFSGSSLDSSRWGTCFPADRWTRDPCTKSVDAGLATSEGAKIEVTGGNLRLWAEKKPIVSSTTGTAFAYRGAMVQMRRAMSAPNANVGTWETNPVDDSLWKYVYVEARIRIPSGTGLWPSFWAMPADTRLGAWPYSGEIDAMEFLPDALTQGPQGDNKIVQNLVWHGLYRGEDCIYHGNGYYVMCPNRLDQAGANPSSDYHLFAYEVSPSGVSMFIDGKQQRFFRRWTTGGESVYAGGDIYPFDQPFFPILHLAVGGAPLYLNPDTTTWPIQSPVPAAYMDVDYVRVYRRLSTWSGGTASTIPPSPIPSRPPAPVAPGAPTARASSPDAPDSGHGGQTPSGPATPSDAAAPASAPVAVDPNAPRNLAVVMVR